MTGPNPKNTGQNLKNAPTQPIILPQIPKMTYLKTKNTGQNPKNTVSEPEILLLNLKMPGLDLKNGV